MEKARLKRLMENMKSRQDELECAVEETRKISHTIKGYMGKRSPTVHTIACLREGVMEYTQHRIPNLNLDLVVEVIDGTIVIIGKTLADHLLFELLSSLTGEDSMVGELG